MKKSKTSAEVKNRYNKKTYDFYRFAVRQDSGLNTKIKGYVKDNPQGLSALVKGLLEEYFEDVED